MKTFHARAESVTQSWYLVDAADMVLGRLASGLARYLQGKHKAIYTPHVDTGDYIIVINAARVRVTGRKAQQHMYHRHSGYPGGLHSKSLEEMLRRRPEFVIHNAVQGMLPKNRLGRAMAKKLKVYATDSHRHAAQQPEPLQL